MTARTNRTIGAGSRWMVVAGVGLVALSFLPFRAVAVHGQQSPITVIRGQVVNGTANEPIAGASLWIEPASDGPRVVLSDGEGAFAVDTSSGSRWLIAQKTGFGRRQWPLPLDRAPARLSLVRGASLSGRVTDEFGEPVRMLPFAHLRLVGAPLPALTRADAEGRFEFRNLAPGHYGLIVTKSGYGSPTIAVAESPFYTASVPLDIVVGQTAVRVNLVLAALGAATGLVLDGSNLPLEGVSVSVLQMRYQDGRRRLVEVNAGRTDDRGIYRIHSLPAGIYVVSAATGTLASGVPGSSRSYFVSTTEPDAAQRVSCLPVRN